MYGVDVPLEGPTLSICLHSDCVFVVVQINAFWMQFRFKSSIGKDFEAFIMVPLGWA